MHINLNKFLGYNTARYKYSLNTVRCLLKGGKHGKIRHRSLYNLCNNSVTFIKAYLYTETLYMYRDIIFSFPYRGEALQGKDINFSSTERVRL